MAEGTGAIARVLLTDRRPGDPEATSDELEQWTNRHWHKHPDSIFCYADLRQMAFAPLRSSFRLWFVGSVTRFGTTTWSEASERSLAAEANCQPNVLASAQTARYIHSTYRSVCVKFSPPPFYNVMLRVLVIAFALLCSWWSYAQQKAPGSTAPAIAAKAALPGKFVDITSVSGVRFQHLASHTSKKYLLETMGSGVALFDYDNDGRLDIFLINGAPLADPTAKGTIPQKSGAKYWNRLFHQRSDGTFEDVTDKSGLQGVGYGLGVAVGDYDNDGYEDLYVTGYGGNRLYHNNGGGTFTDVTERAGVGGSGWSTSAAWIDVDNDGLLDLVVRRYLLWDFDDIYCGEHREGYRAYCHPDYFRA